MYELNVHYMSTGCGKIPHYVDSMSGQSPEKTTSL